MSKQDALNDVLVAEHSIKTDYTANEITAMNIIREKHNEAVRMLIDEAIFLQLPEIFINELKEKL